MVHLRTFTGTCTAHALEQHQEEVRPPYAVAQKTHFDAEEYALGAAPNVKSVVTHGAGVEPGRTISTTRYHEPEHQIGYSP